MLKMVNMTAHLSVVVKVNPMELKTEVEWEQLREKKMVQWLSPA